MVLMKEVDTVKKYQIIIDSEKLSSLRYKIINDCSTIEHINMRVKENCLPYDDDIYIRNYHQRFVERVSNNDFFGPPLIDIYQVEYDKYNEPDIIKLIDKVIEGNEEAAIELLSYNKKSKKDYKEEINKLLEDKENIVNNIEKINELLEEEKYNKSQKDISFYLQDIKACISLILIDECSYDDYQRFCKFCDQGEKLMSNSDLIHKFCLHKN